MPRKVSRDQSGPSLHRPIALSRAVIITGRPSVGKTTVFLRVVDSLRASGRIVGGFVSKEVRIGGSRVGFELVDLTSHRKGWLAHIDQPNGPRVGKYRVNTEDLVEIGVGAINNALLESRVDTIAVDEIGPMELTSQHFVRAISDALNSSKLLFATIHYRERERILSMFNLKATVQLFEIMIDNRETVYQKIMDAVASGSRRRS